MICRVLLGNVSAERMRSLKQTANELKGAEEMKGIDATVSSLDGDCAEMIFTQPGKLPPNLQSEAEELIIRGVREALMPILKKGVALTDISVSF